MTQEAKPYSTTEKDFSYCLPMDSIRTLILRLVEERGANLAAISRSMGRNHAYLHQFIYREVPATLREGDREALAPLLGVTPDDLRSADRRPSQQAMPGAARAPRISRPRAVVELGSEIPIYGPAQGGEGAEILTSDPIDILRPPHALVGTRDGYGVLVTGESMVPALKPGDIALINPHLPPRPGDEVVLQRTDHGTKYGIIKTLIRSTPTEWHLQQWNPKRKLVKTKKDWPDCHTVVGKVSRR